MMNEARELFPELMRALSKADGVLIVSHEFTDGDDLGSTLALTEALEALGVRCYPAAYGGVGDNLLYLPNAQRVLGRIPEENFDTVVYVGCGEMRRIGFDGWMPGERMTVNIDHHPDNKRFARLNLVDPVASATCEIVYDFLKFSKINITKSMAVCLLGGIFGDTGGFRHANTTARVLEIAADLMRRGARIDRIADYYFGRAELPKLRAWAKALENARFDPAQQMVYSIVTETELAEIGADPEDLEGVASVLNTIPEAKYSMLLKQRGDEIKGSLRSESYKGVDVSEIARSYGGGGHKLAAGFKLKGKIEKTPDGWKIT